MPNFSFPSNPAVGQFSTQANGRTYRWTGAAWELVLSSGSANVTATSIIRAIIFS